jgi:hypothetical protein
VKAIFLPATWHRRVNLIGIVIILPLLLALARKNGPFFECFPYVCPEPVLVKSTG